MIIFIKETNKQMCMCFKKQIFMCFSNIKIMLIDVIYFTIYLVSILRKVVYVTKIF